MLTFEGIGTKWWINIFDNIEDSKLEILNKSIIKTVSDFESKYSRFQDDSEVSKLNNLKYLEQPSTDLLEMVKLSEEARVISENYFNIGVGSILVSNGYDSKYSFKSNGTSTPIVESQVVNLSKSLVEIKSSANIDLGGIGKGYLIDKIANLINDFGIKYYYINAGGDIFATSNHENNIEFALQSPFFENEMVGIIKIKNQAIASSSNSKRQWIDHSNGKKRGHLVNVKNDANSKIAAVYTAAPKALNADLASTALFVSPDYLYNKIAKKYFTEFLVLFEDGTFIKSENYNAELFIRKSQ